VTERFAAGERVRTLAIDPAHHTRLPRYARGKTGIIVEREGSHQRPDEHSRGLDVSPEPVYAVRFAASELWADGDHSVVVDLWESYLEPVEGEGRT
jgi:hypothetical protein